MKNNETKKMILSGNISDDVSNILELALINLGYNRKQVIHYCLLIEEAVLRWKETLSEDSELTVTRDDTARDVVFRFRMSGEKVNPFEVEDAGHYDVTITTMVDRLMSGVGNELKYSYAKSENVVTLRLPKRNIESTLYRRTLLVLVIPLAIQSVVTNLATSVDTFMMGFFNEDSLSALGLASQFNSINMLMILAVTVGESMLIAQFWGKRDRTSVRYTLKICMIWGFVVSAVFFIGAMFFSRQIMMFYTDVPEFIDEGSLYLRYISFSYLIIPFYQVLYGFLRTTGSVRVSMKCAIYGCALNIVLNGILIFGMFGIEPMGVRGAGIATICSAALQLILVLVYSKGRLSGFGAAATDTMQMDFIKKTLLSKSVPVLIQYFVYLIGVNITAAAFGHMGPDVTAANAIMASVLPVFFSVKGGIGNATGILIGASLGRNEFDKAWQNSHDSMRIAACTGVVVALIMIGFVTALRFTSLQLGDGALYYLWFVMAAYGINAFFGFLNGVTTTGTLTAGGESSSVLIADAIITFIVMIPLSMLYIKTDMLPIVPLFMVLKMEEVLSFPIKYYYVRKKKWLRNITKQR